MGYIKKINPLWKKYEKDILEEVSRISGLKWKKDEIWCYVVGKVVPFSDPLTLPIYRNNYNYFIDILIHELIHQLFTQKGNLKKAEDAWDYINKKFKEESITTRIHIPLHAFHAHIYLKFFNKSRMKRDYNYMKSFKDYKRSWEIVEEIGH